MKEFFRAYRILAVTSIKSALQYRFSFIANILGLGALAVVDFLLIAAIILRFKTIGGWDPWEVAVLYGMSSSALGLFRVVGSEIHEFDNYLVAGEFDALLTRPWDPLFVLLTRKIDINRLGAPLQGIIITGIGVAHLVATGELTPLAAALIPLFVINGFLIYTGISVATATLGFWTTRIDDLQPVTIYAPSNAAMYPLTIFPGWLRGILTSLLPVALTNYVPLLYLLGKGASWIVLPGSLIATWLFLWLVRRFWLVGLRHYNSTGS
ncbi:MAG: ABC transporter permease [Chloroflexota bacterium]